LTAEALRDSLFAVAGALEEGGGGAPFGANSMTPRRSVYVRAKRNDLDAFLATFDAPTPFAPVGARLVTNVPAQSLALLNDPLVWNLAARWASATARQGDDARAADMFEAATGRAPTAIERGQLLAYVEAAAAAADEHAGLLDASDAAIAAKRRQLAAILEPARASLLESGETEPGPAPTAAWDFGEGLRDQVGALHGTLRGSARVEDGALVLDGGGWLSTAPLPSPLAAKTLEAWVQLDTLDQRGGGVVTVQDLQGDVFDSIVYGERQPARWIAGSDHFNRTDDVGGPAERAALDRPVHLAVVYDGQGAVTIYRDGRPYGRSYEAGVARFAAGKAQVLIGLRHGDSAGGRALRGRVRAARLYDRALRPEEVAASSAGQPFVSRSRVLASLSDAARGRVQQLNEELRALRDERAKHTQEATDRDPWTLLAHALFNLKEFRFLR
ncbi:MAG: DUF1553 domain-containing protein, partial [Planctomycetota bacterium]|nr:DUF1553 domain-containing protein [Planctomycetota bacterium]